MMLLLHYGGMKKRLQIQLDPEDYSALRSWASALGVSMSAAVRMLVRERLRDDGSQVESRERFRAAAGFLTEPDGAGEVSSEHDWILYGGGE
jgi:hypothetical protein